MSDIIARIDPASGKVTGYINLKGILKDPGTNTSVDVLKDIIADLDYVLLMSVNPGYGGQKFIPATLKKIEAMNLMRRSRNQHCLIEVDGGVNEKNAQDIIEAGADYVRLTAQGVKEAENLALIKAGLRKAGFDTPLIADIHFNPLAAETAARLVEKVRINPGNPPYCAGPAETGMSGVNHASSVVLSCLAIA